MTGPAAMMPVSPAPSPAAGTARIANPAKSAESGKGERGGFGHLLSSLTSEAETPNLDAEANRDDAAESSPPPLGMPIQLQIFPDKTPQLRFAEELSAAAFPKDGALPTDGPAATTPGADAAVDALAGADFQASEAAAAAALAQQPARGGPVSAVSDLPVQAAAAAIASGLSGIRDLPVKAAVAAVASGKAGTVAAPAADPALDMLAEAPAIGVPAEPVPGQKERAAAKTSKNDASTTNAPAATTIMAGMEPVAPQPASASSDQGSREDGKQGDAARTLALLKDANVSSVQQETHLAPAPQLSPAFQIANRIMQDVKASDPTLAVQPAVAPSEAPAAGPVKVLELKLDPPDLGALTIRLSMKDDTLHLQIEASRHETARLIERDRDVLSGMLRSAGYGGDGLSVQITSGDRGNGAQQFSGGSAFNQPAGQNSAGRQPENNGSGQAWQRAFEPDRTTGEPVRETETPGAPRSRSGPVYL